MQRALFVYSSVCMCVHQYHLIPRGLEQDKGGTGNTGVQLEWSGCTLTIIRNLWARMLVWKCLTFRKERDGCGDTPCLSYHLCDSQQNVTNKTSHQKTCASSALSQQLYWCEKKSLHLQTIYKHRQLCWGLLCTHDPHETFARGPPASPLPILSSSDVSISFSQTDQLDVYLTHLPLSSFNQEHNITSQATFPFPHFSLFFSSPGSLLNHSSLPLLFSLSIPMNAQSPVQQGLSWGVGFRGHTLIRTPRCVCTSADEQTPITGSDKKWERKIKTGRVKAIMMRTEFCFSWCNIFTMENLTTKIAKHHVLLQLLIETA